jgi:hypothetical protein
MYRERSLRELTKDGNMEMTHQTRREVETHDTILKVTMDNRPYRR